MFTVYADSMQTYMWVSGLLDAARAGEADKDLADIYKLFRESGVVSDHVEFTMVAVMASRVLNLLNGHTDKSSITLLGYLISPVVMHRMPGVTREEIVEAIRLGVGDFEARVPVDEARRVTLFAAIASVLVEPGEDPFAVTYRLTASESWSELLRVQR